MLPAKLARLNSAIDKPCQLFFVCGPAQHYAGGGLHELMLGTDKVKRLLQEPSREKVLAGITDAKMVRMVCIK